MPEIIEVNVPEKVKILAWRGGQWQTGPRKGQWFIDLDTEWCGVRRSFRGIGETPMVALRDAVRDSETSLYD